VFVLPPADPAHRARLRIFTPALELPFAGHPTVGTAMLLGRIDGGAEREIVVEERIGLVRCRTAMIDGDRGRASFVLPQLPTSAGAGVDAATAAAALSLDSGDIGFDGFVPSRWSAGLAQDFGPVRSAAAFGRARPASESFAAAFAAEGRGIAYLYCAEAAEKGHDFHARMFAHGMGLYEDPATGSAAAAFSGLLAASGRYADGEHTVRI